MTTSKGTVAGLRARSTTRAGIGGDAGRAVHLAEILKAVAHPLRLRIIALLVDGEQHVNALCEELAASQSIVSQQLRILRMRRLVEARREGGFVHYRLLEPELRKMLECMERCSIG